MKSFQLLQKEISLRWKNFTLGTFNQKNENLNWLKIFQVTTNDFSSQKEIMKQALLLKKASKSLATESSHLQIILNEKKFSILMRKKI